LCVLPRRAIVCMVGKESSKRLQVTPTERERERERETETETEIGTCQLC
jgi:hypothetical protein